jgi:hypothetical protein
MKIKTHFMFNNFFPENRAVYEIVWENMVESREATDDTIIRLMCLAHGITKATNT